MESAEGNIKFLVLDPERSFTELVHHPMNQGNEKFTWCTGAKEAINLLCDRNVQIDGFFLSEDVTEVEWLTCVRAAVMARSSIPSYNLISEGHYWRLSDAELALIKENKTLLIYKSKLRNMIETIEQLSVGFDKGKVLSLARNEETGVDVGSNDSEFFPVRVSQFMTGKTSIFDVYVKLVHNMKYIKVFSAKDPFDHERIRNYATKGLEFFYIRTEAAKGFVEYTDHITKNVVKSQNVDLESKYSIILSQACQSLRHFRDNPSEDTVDFSKRYVSYAKTVIEELRACKPDNFPIGFYAHLTQFEHSAATVLVAGLIAIEMSVNSTKSLEWVTMTALLHDLSLSEKESRISPDDYITLSDEMKSKYFEHPKLSVNVLKDLKNVDESVIQGILQHHVRVRGTSFPKKVANQPINWISNVIGMADEIVHAIYRLSQDWRRADMDSLQAYLDQVVFPNFSKSIVIPTKIALFPKPVKKEE